MPERPRFRSVLVAIDGSPHADLALAVAIAIAQRDHARLTIITVAGTIGAAAWSGVVSPTELQAEVDHGAQKVLRAAVDAVPDDLPVSTVMPHGPAGPAIVEEVKRGRHDAVVLGARGRGRIGAAVGSVHNFVLHHADAAVFVAHAPKSDPEVTAPPPS
jgi:nucleotide-binding universal stress UspA family protein